jgi:hypothetical protein
MKLFRLLAWGLCLGVLAFASEPMRPHAAARPNLQKELEGKGVHGQKDNQPVTAEEWVQVQAWMMANNCHKRLDFCNRMSENAQKEHAKLLIAQQYRQIQRTKDKALQNAMIQEAQAQDMIFGAQLKLREARHEAHDKPQREQARKEIHDAVGHLIDAQADRFQAESQHLRNNKPALIEEWSRGMIKSAGGAVTGDGSDGTESENASPGQTTSPGTR